MKYLIRGRAYLTSLFTIMLIFFACMVMISCNKNGEHILVNFDKHLQVNESEEHSPKILDPDSVERVSKSTSDSLTLKEHRVYYVDYSYSMISKGYDRKNNYYDNTNVNGTGYNLLELVKRGLKESIREISRENVSIEIIPFLDNELWKENTPPKIFRIEKNKVFEDIELKKMDAFIDDISANGMEKYNTHHSVAIRDFLENRINDNSQYHMMILLTDGLDESSVNHLESGASILKDKWGKSTSGKYVFGIFVNLIENSKHLDNEDLPKCFKGEENERNRRYYKEGLNFYFNICTLETSNLTVEHRTTNQASVTVGGVVPVFENTVQIDKDSLYKYTLEQPSKSKSYMLIHVDTLPLPPARKERPNTYNYKFRLNPPKDGTHFILSHYELDITVIDEKTPNIKFWIANHTNDTVPCVSQKLEYYKKLFGVINPECSDTITIRIPYEKSNDAKSKEEFNKIKLTVSDIPEYAKLISKSEIDLDKPSDTVSITFALDPSNAKLIDDQMLEGCIKITGTDSLKAIFVNNSPLSQISSANTIGLFKVKAVERCHPLLVFLFWLFTILLGLWLIAMAGILVWRNKRPHFMNNIDALQLETKPQNMGANYILFTNSQLGLTTLLPLPKDKTKFICCVRFDVNCKCHEKKEWGLCNWWKLNIAFSGDIYIYPLTPNPNKFNIKTIELKPSSDSNKIEIWINGKKTRDISQRNIPYEIASCQGVLLNVKAIRQPVINQTMAINKSNNKFNV